MTDNHRWTYHQCPGVPGLVEHCPRRLRTRKLCEDCERTAKAGRVVGEKRCLGISAIGHVCTAQVNSRPRCRACEALFNKYQGNVKGRRNQLFNRVCLRCDRPFVTYNKFIRLCKSCKHTHSAMDFNGASEGRHASVRTKRVGGHT